METKTLSSLPTFANDLLDPAKALVPISDLARLTVTIRAAHADAIKSLGDSISASIAAGEALTLAKALVKKEHCSWEDYVAVELRITARTASTYMRLAKEKDKLNHLVGSNRNHNSVFTQSQALAVLRQERKAKRPKRKPVTA